MKTLLTGVAGTGKSTLARALNERGVASIDLHDVPGLFYWQDKKTQQKIEYTPGRPKEWFESVDRICDIDMLKNILNQYKDIVAAGTTGGGNQKEFLSLFDRVILLQSNPETLIRRMQTRTNKSGYGKTKEEQEDNIKWQKEFDNTLLSQGAISVSTEGDLDVVVERTIKVIKEN